MSHCMAHNWNPRHQRQELVGGGGGEGSRSSHMHSQLHDRIQSLVVPMSDCEVAELTWENGQIALHGLGGLLPTSPAKPTWARAGDTLESVVHQATSHKQNPNLVTPDESDRTSAKRPEILGQAHGAPSFMEKRMLSNSDRCERNLGDSIQEERSPCASGRATFSKDPDATTRTWTSFDFPWNLKTKSTREDLGSRRDVGNRDRERGMSKGEAAQSHSTRRSRAAVVHNQSERRRRDRINQKMKDLQKLVPNASKTDKASMLDEVIEYLKQLQAQVQMMSVRNMPQMMMPMGLQPQIQMSLLAQMGMGYRLGMGMGGAHYPPPVAAASPAFLPPAFMPPPMIPAQAQAQTSPDAAASNSIPPNDPYSAFLAQSMNMDLYNKMAAIYRQQASQTIQPSSSPFPSSHAQGG